MLTNEIIIKILFPNKLKILLNKKTEELLTALDKFSININKN